MKKNFKMKWGFLLAIVLVFLAGQAMAQGFLCNGEVTGTVVGISDSDEVPTFITVEPDDDSADLIFKGIPVQFLEKFLAAKCLDTEFTLLGASVTVSYHECPNPDSDDSQLKACSITITDCCQDSCEFELPVRRGKAFSIPPAPPAPPAQTPQAPPSGAGAGSGKGYRGGR